MSDPTRKQINNYPLLPSLDGSEVAHVVQQGNSKTTQVRTILTSLIDGGYWDDSLKKYILPTHVDPDFSGSINVLRVAATHPRASDAKNNRGTDPNRPFRTPERALLEVARRSFVPGPANDINARDVILISSGEYDIQNGVGGGSANPSFNRYQDGANLVIANQDWIADQVFSIIPVPYQSSTCRRDLTYFISAIANDLSAFSNSQTLYVARYIRDINGFYIAAYNTPEERSQTMTALGNLRTYVAQAIQNLGGVTDPTIVPDPVGPPNQCSNVIATANTLIDILYGTLQGTVNPWSVAMNLGSGYANFPEEGEPTPEQLRSFNNSATPGVIIPRGASVIGDSLRTVKIRPTFVPNRDGSEGKSGIFRWTGNTFFGGFTVFDSRTVNQSHHNLSVFEFCSLPDLQNYYDKVAIAFHDPAYYNLLQDASNLVRANQSWIAARASVQDPILSASNDLKSEIAIYMPQFIRAIVSDLRAGNSVQTKALGNTILNVYIASLVDPDKANAINVLSGAFMAIADYARMAAINQASTSQGGFVDPRVPFDTANPQTPCASIQSAIMTYGQIVGAILASNPEPDVNLPPFGTADVEASTGENQMVGIVQDGYVEVAVDNASPYAYSITLRSKYGMNGVRADGAIVSGLKSYLSAQFTTISAQVDSYCFTAAPQNSGEVGLKRYFGTKLSDAQDRRHYGHFLLNGAFAQLVSCFGIQCAVHVGTDSGAEVSMNNSFTNFGDVALESRGYLGQGTNYGAYPQDRGHTWTAIKRPAPIDRTPREILIGNYDSRSSNAITLTGSVDFVALGGFTIRAGTNIYVRDLDGNELSATVQTTMNADSTQKDVIYFSSLNQVWPGEELLLGRQVYIKRVIDTRSLDERIYKIRFTRPPGSRIPVANFILRFDYDTVGRQLGFAQNQVFYLSEIEADPSNQAFCTATILQGWVDETGRMDSDVFILPDIDLDVEPSPSAPNDNPTDSITYQALYHLLIGLGYGLPQINQALVTSSSDYVLPVATRIEFNKPSQIVCGAHTFQYCGGLNYDTAIPSVQPGSVGDGMDSDLLAAQKRLSKLQTQITGGRVYANGMDELGNFYIGQIKIDVKTGKQSDLRLEGTNQSGSQSLESLYITRLLTIAETATEKVQGKLEFSTNSQLSIPPSANLVKAYIDPQTQQTRYGFGRPGTDDEITNNRAVDGGAAWVTTSGLSNWATVQKVARQRSGTINVYVGTGWVNPPVRYDINYDNQYWPAPQSDRNSNQKIFAPFQRLADAAAWASQNVSPLETIQLLISPGAYSARATFNCSILINGANGTGQIGAFTDFSTSVLLYSRPLVDFNYGQNGTVLLGVEEGIQAVEQTISRVHCLSTDETLACAAVPDDDLGGTQVMSYSLSRRVRTKAAGQRYAQWIANSVDVYKQQNPGYPSYGGLPRVIDLMHTYLFKAINGFVSLREVTIGSRTPAITSSMFAGGVIQNGLIALVDSYVSLAGVRLRGNEVWNATASLSVVSGVSTVPAGIWYGFCSAFISYEGNCGIGFGGQDSTPISPTNTYDRFYNLAQNNIHLQRVYTGNDSRNGGSDAGLQGVPGAVWAVDWSQRGPAMNNFFFNKFGGSITENNQYDIWYAYHVSTTGGAEQGFIGQFGNVDNLGTPPNSWYWDGGGTFVLKNQYTFSSFATTFWQMAGGLNCADPTFPAATPGANTLVFFPELNIRLFRVRKGVDVENVGTFLTNLEL